MKRLIITEEEKKNIKKLYSLLLEDEGECNLWRDKTFKSGDGIKEPKITVNLTESEIYGKYEGPDKGGCIQSKKGNPNDTPHQLASIVVFYDGAPYLKQLYGKGVFVKPDMDNIKMTRVPNKSFEIKIPLIKVEESKAITNMNTRGSMGGGTGGIDMTEIDKIRANKDYLMQEEKTLTSDNITQIFICFRDIVGFPIGGSQQNNSGQTQPPKPENNNNQGTSNNQGANQGNQGANQGDQGGGTMADDWK